VGAAISTTTLACPLKLFKTISSNELDVCTVCLVHPIQSIRVDIVLTSDANSSTSDCVVGTLPKSRLACLSRTLADPESRGSILLYFTGHNIPTYRPMWMGQSRNVHAPVDARQYLVVKRHASSIFGHRLLPSYYYRFKVLAHWPFSNVNCPEDWDM
jgi:hypothetical protein